MSDKNTLAQDWKQIGDDMRVAMGLKKYQLPHVAGALESTIMGLGAFNIFGDRIKRYR